MIIKGLPQFTRDEELFKFIVENEESIFAQAKSEKKLADATFYHCIQMRDNIIIGKSQENKEERNPNELKVRAIINTTNLLDSHGDVHIKGIWDKSLKENKRILHAQEHKSNQFDKIISSGDDLNAFVKDYTWKQLGYNMEGKTQALVFDSTVKKTRNPYMFDQYQNKYVNNHSVGMYYVKMITCLNSDSEDFKAYKDNWDKYKEFIVNQDSLLNKKMFWAVTEAKAVEGSAVPNGSNWVTPTVDTKNIEVDGEVIDKNEKKLITIKNWLNK